MRERNGPGGIKTERRSPMITSGVATPSAASNSITVVITIPPSSPATRPAKIAFVLLIQREYELWRRLCQAPDHSLRRSPQRTPLQQFSVTLGRPKKFSYPLHDHRRCQLFHAGMVKRALAQPAVIAWRTWQVQAHDRFRSPIRSDANRIRRAEHADHRLAERRSDMHCARIIRHANLGTLNKRCQFCGRRFAGKITCAGCGGCDLSASRLIAFCTRQSDSKSLVKKVPRDSCESFNGPVLGLPYGSRRQHRDRFRRGHAALLQEALHITRSLR